jgi:hypothetical protein
MQEPLAELAAYSCPFPWYQVPDADLARLTAAARVAGHRWDAIAHACDNGPGKDIPAVIRQQYWISPGTGPGPLFSATQHAARTLDGRGSGCFPPLTWPAHCAGSRSPTWPTAGGRSTPRSATRRAAPGWLATRRPTTRCGGTGCPG